jgi:hypothetical protein
LGPVLGGECDVSSDPYVQRVDHDMEQVIIGVDPHELSATIEVVEAQEKLLGSGRLTTDQPGYAAKRRYAKT